MLPRRSVAVRHRCRRAAEHRNTAFEEVANDLGGSVQDKSGEDANESGTREHRRGQRGIEAAPSHTERVRPARAGVAHEPARGAIIFGVGNSPV